EYARKVPEEMAPDRLQTDPKLRTRDFGTLELAALDAEPERVAYTRPRALGTYGAVLLLMIITLLAFAHFAPFSSPHAGPAAQATASATDTAPSQPSATPTATPPIVPNSTIPAPGGGAPVPTPGEEMPFTVTAAYADAAPTTAEINCDRTQPTYFNGALYVPGTTKGGVVTYRWVHSDGSRSPTETVTMAPTNKPSFYGPTPDTVFTHTWYVDALTGVGSKKWTKMEVLSPQHLLSPPAYFMLKSLFGIKTAAPSGQSQAEYDC